jgi:hypothetical protein
MRIIDADSEYDQLRSRRAEQLLRVSHKIIDVCAPMPAFTIGVPQIDGGNGAASTMLSPKTMTAEGVVRMTSRIAKYLSRLSKGRKGPIL